MWFQNIVDNSSGLVDEVVSNCIVNFFSCHTQERDQEHTSWWLLLKGTRIQRFCAKKNIWLKLAIYLITKKSANATEGHCQEVCFFFITSIWNSWNSKFWSLKFCVRCQMTGRTEATKTFKRLAKSSQTWLIRLGTVEGGSDNPTWPVATVAHYKQDISAH